MPEISSVKQFFAEVMPEVVSNPEKSAGMNSTYQFSISGDDGGEWNLALADGTGKVSEGTADGADCTVSCTDADWLKIVKGELNPQMAFMQGKIKIKGNMGLALKLQGFLKA